MATLAQRHAELINVYKALGGGWVDAADPLAPKPQEPISSGASDKNAAIASTSMPSGAPASASSAAVSPAAASAQDRVAAGLEGQVSVVDIYRVVGAGGVQVQAPAGGWPQGVEVRLHGFRSLPNLRADAPGRTMECVPARGGQDNGKYDCKLGGASVNATRTTPSYVQVSLPQAFLRTDTTHVELRWSERAAVADQ